MNPLSLLSGVWGAVAAVFNWLTGKGGTNNTPEMKDADKAKKEAAQNDKNRENITNRDVSASRDSLAP